MIIIKHEEHEGREDKIPGELLILFILFQFANPGFHGFKLDISSRITPDPRVIYPKFVTQPQDSPDQGDYSGFEKNFPVVVRSTNSIRPRRMNLSISSGCRPELYATSETA